MTEGGRCKINNTLPAIDVILPFHVVNSYLREAIKSVERSTGVNARLILVNDTGSGSYLELYTPSIQAIEVYTDSPGYVSALAKGILSSSSDFIGFLDSDDITSPARFARQINHLLEDGADLSTGVLQTMNAKGKVIPKRPILGKIPSPKNPRELFLLGSHGADSALVGRGDFIRKEWKSHANFPASLADFGWFFSLPPTTKVVHTHDAIYFYRSHNLQISRTNRLLMNWNEVYPTFLKHQDNNFNTLGELNLHEFPPNVVAALVFPSSMPKLTSSQKKELFRARKTILKSLKIRNEKKSDYLLWRKTLNRRCFIATRELRPMFFQSALTIIVDMCINSMFNVRMRNNS